MIPCAPRDAGMAVQAMQYPLTFVFFSFGFNVTC